MFRMPAPRTSAEITAKPDCRSALFQGPSLQCPWTVRATCLGFILVILGAEVTLIIPSSHALKPCNIMQSTHPFIHHSHSISYRIPLKKHPLIARTHPICYDLLGTLTDLCPQWYQTNGINQRKRRVFWRRHHVPRDKKSQGSPRFTSSRKGQRISQALQ